MTTLKTHNHTAGASGDSRYRHPFADCAAVAEGLRLRRPEWLPQVFPAGTIEGNTFFLGDPDGTPGRSMPTPLDGSQPIICDFASDFSGDDLDLYARGTGQSLADARQDAAERLGYSDGAWRGRQVDQGLLRKKQEEAERRDRQRAGWAKGIWDRTADPAGTPVEHYARRRALRGTIPESHRFAGRLLHKDSGLYLPALVAKVTDNRDGAFLGVHRIYLDPDTGWKAKVTKPKVSLGPVKSGSVEIGTAPGALILVEGIENAWSIWGAIGDRGTVRALVGAEMMRRQKLPKRNDYGGHLVIAADNDKAGIKGTEALRDRAFALGWKVQVMFPPKGTDFNAIAMKEAGYE